MKNEELLKAYSKFEGAEWWPFNLEIHNCQHSDENNFPYLLWIQSGVCRIPSEIGLLAIRGAAEGWLCDNLYYARFTDIGYVVRDLYEDSVGDYCPTIDEAIITALKELANERNN